MSQISNDRFPWITIDLFERILKNHDHADSIVIDFMLTEAVAKGDNYGSEMIRVLVKYIVGSELKQKPFVIKAAFSAEIMDTVFLDLFGREVAFYRDILPKYGKYQDKIDPNFKCAPKCYHVNEDPLYFVFEDLKVDNFSNLDRYVGLTFDASVLVLKKLAKLHAINAMVYEDNPELFKPFNRKLYCTENSAIVGGVTSFLRDCQQVCLTWPGYEQYSDKIKDFLNNVLTKFDRAYDTINDDTFTTLIHGDLWVNNIMYKLDETTNKPVDVIIIDYQIGYYGSPALDLAYLFYTSTANDIEEREWDRLIQVYHGELEKSLKLLEYRKHVPTLTELQIEMLKRPFIAVVHSFMLFRFIESSDDASLEVMMGDSEISRRLRHQLFEKSGVKQRMQYFLDFYGRKGLFE